MEANNMEAMREALEAFVEYSELVCRMGIFTRDGLVEITTKARDALAEPPRNCDVGTAEEQANRYVNFCDTYRRDDGFKPCTGCPCCGKIPFGKCEFAWAQMPYEPAKEGGAS